MISWRAGPIRDTVHAFVEAVTTPGGAGYAPPAERLAVFDNDGTLWCEKPLMVHIYALLARYRQLARHEPLGLSRRALRAVFTNDHADFDNVFQRSEWAEILGDLAGVPFSEMSDADFEAWVRDWAAHWQHPRFGVGVRIHGDRAIAQRARRAHDAAGNFPAVGNQYLRKTHGRGSVPSSLQMMPSITSSAPPPIDTRRPSRQARETGLSQV